MIRTIGAAAAVLAVFLVPPPALAQMSVVTADTNLADIARRVGGDKVRVESLARGVDDPHAVDPRPSMVVKLARADVVARIGMDLDLWMDSVLEKSGNPKVMKGGPGYADCSRNLKVLEAPPARIDASMGDIHIYGNPHYLLDPANGILAAGNIAAALIRVDPRNQPYYHARFLAFGNEVKDRLARWRAALEPHKGAQIAVYHRTWVYFVTRFGLKEYSAIEPKPGIPPGPSHVTSLARSMKADGVKVVLSETFRSRRFPDLVASQSGAKTVFVPVSVEGERGVDSYFALFDAIVGRLANALK